MDTRKIASKRVSGATPMPSVLRRSANLVKEVSNAPTQPDTGTGLTAVKTTVAQAGGPVRHPAWLGR
jgi:hypothetical protein